MNNKEKGNKFEDDFAEFLSAQNYWVAPFPGKNGSNSQPADLIACHKNKVWLIDCKTLENKSGTFPTERIEENQRLCCERFKECENHNYFLAILWNNDVYFVSLNFIDYQNQKSFNVKDFPIIKRGFYENTNR